MGEVISRRAIVGINLPISNNNALQRKYEAIMSPINPELMKIVVKFCSQRDICRDTEKQCKPKECKYFRFIVLPTWRKDIKARKGERWESSQEYREYDAIIDLFY